MKRILSLTVMLLCVSLLCGCQFWMDGEHFSVKPHTENYAPQDPGVLSAYSYTSLRNVLESLVEDAASEAVINLSGFNMDQMDTFMNRAINQIKRSHPVAAYALNEITVLFALIYFKHRCKACCMVD